MNFKWYVVVAVACCGWLLPPALVGQNAQAELLAADKALSALSSDSGFPSALIRSLDSEGVLLWPGAPVLVGPAQARSVLVSFQEPTRLLWQPLGVELAGDSTLGISWGVAVSAPTVTPGSPQIGRYTAVWQRSGRKWALAAVLFMNVKPVATLIPAGIPLARSPVRSSGPASRFIAADLAFAQLAQDSGAVIAFQTWAAPNAFVIGGVLTRGPEAIARGVNGPASWRWHPVAGGSSRSGDLGWTVGEAIISPDVGEPNYSKYLTVWTRTRDDSIRFLTDGGNARPRDSALR